MSFYNPAHRPVLEAEGMEVLDFVQLDGYVLLRAAVKEQGFFVRPPV